MLQRGDTFGTYRIVTRLKAGGMAQLYLARREGAAGFRRPVALKVIHAHLARQEEFVRMFVDEATLSSKIHDPNVVHVEDLGNVGGTFFLAMEYVHGIALAALLRAARETGRRLAPGFIAHVGAQVASGLHAAHETTDETGAPLGIVHRDVSPQNVLLAFKGHVKLIDFGVAKAYGKRHETNVGSIQGKLGYMPPEQARSEAIDRRADVYALGIVLWEMLAGRRLFEAENELALLERVRNPRLEPPSRFATDVPPALDAAVMRMLAPRADDRPPTALHVKRMLLDAVPDARNVEAHDVAALLRALVPKHIAEQDRVLATLEDMGGAAPTSSPAEVEDVTTEKRVDPVEALHQLTVPAVVPPPSSRRPASSAPAMLLVALAALAVVVAVAFLGRQTPRAPETAAFPEAPPLPTTTTVDAPAATSASPLPTASATAATTATATTTTTTTTTTTKPAAKTPPRRRPSTPSTTSSSKGGCQKVGGLDLCE